MSKLARLEQAQGLLDLCRWLIIGSMIGIITGTSSAALLRSLDWATDWRAAHPSIVWLLPLGGLLSGLIYNYFGHSVTAGNHLLVAEIEAPQAIIPVRMAPLILIGTTIAHLFGASVGREGTALQMAGSLADQLTPILRLNNPDRRILLTAAISGGVGSVFGTPLTGMVFGLEVLKFGGLRYEGIFACLIAAIVGDQVTIAWGLDHQVYQISIVPELTIWRLLAAIGAGILFGLAARVFVSLTHQIKGYFQNINYAPARPLIGGALVLIAIQLVGVKYIGLGIGTIVSAFSSQLSPWDFAAKIGFTALSLGSGFKGGEATPLFYIGATLGNALAPLLGLPSPLLAGMGFVAVFGGAAHVPLAAILMAIELFGAPVGSYAGIACTVSYLCAGKSGIYSSPRIAGQHRA